MLKCIHIEGDVCDVEELKALEKELDEDEKQEQTDEADNNSVTEDSPEKL